MSYESYNPHAIMNWPMAPLIPRDCYTPFRAMSRASPHHDVLTNVTVDKDKYQISMDIHQFAPHEVIVKTAGDMIIVEGKHEEKQDDHGYISRHFVRKYKLPHDHLEDDVVSSLSSDGILCITAPKKNPDAVLGERMVPIHVMGPVHKPISHDSSHRAHGHHANGHHKKPDQEIKVQHMH